MAPNLVSVLIIASLAIAILSTTLQAQGLIPRSIYESLAMAPNLVCVVIIASLAIAILCTTLQAQGVKEAAAGGNAAEYVLLEPRPEHLVVPAGAGASAAATNASTPACGNCKCCLKSTNPLVCLPTCCFVKTCSGGTCTSQTVSCGCNKSVW